MDELIRQACIVTGFPNMAKEHLPDSLSEETKQKNQKAGLDAERFGQILKEAVEQINHGAIDSLDELVRLRLK